MKKIMVLILLVGLCGISSLQAQRCLPGQKGLQLSAGTVDGYFGQVGREPAFYAAASLISYTQKGSYWAFGLDYLEKRYDYENTRIPLAQFTAAGGYYYSFLSGKRKNFFLSTGITGVLGYEIVNWNEKLLSDGATIENGDAFLYGLGVGLNMEVFLCDKIAWLFHVEERILFGSSVSKFHTLIGTGIRVVLN